MDRPLYKLYEGCRSYRRFKQEKISEEILYELVETAGKRSSAMNKQPLRYIIADSEEIVEKIQPCIHWAAKLPKEIGTPKKDERPTAFIIILEPVKSNSMTNIDIGIALDTMAITAWSHNIGSCIINSVNRKKLSEIISIPEYFSIGPILALGYPIHKSTIVKPEREHGLDYYVDDDRNYYVPKHPLEEIVKHI